MQDEFLVHTREGEPCPSLRRRRSSGSSSPAARPTSARAARCGCARRDAASAVRPSVNVGGVAGKTVKTEAVVLRSIRYGEADRILHLYSTTRGRIGAIAKGARKPKSRFGGRLEPFFRLDLVLHEGRGDLLTVTNVADGRRLPAPALLRRRRSTPAPAPATRSCACSTRPSPTRPPTTCSAATSRCSTTPAEPRAAGARGGALLPAQAGAGRRLRPRARLLRPLRRGRAPGRLLRRRRRRRLRQLRGGLLPALRGGAPLHGRGAGASRSPRRPAAEPRRCARSSARSGETLEHHAHVQLRAAA